MTGLRGHTHACVWMYGTRKKGVEDKMDDYGQVHTAQDRTLWLLTVCWRKGINQSSITLVQSVGYNVPGNLASIAVHQFLAAICDTVFPGCCLSRLGCKLLSCGIHICCQSLQLMGSRTGSKCHVTN